MTNLDLGSERNPRKVLDLMNECDLDLQMDLEVALDKA